MRTLKLRRIIRRVKKNIDESISTSKKNINPADSFSYRDVSVTNIVTPVHTIALPFGASKIHLTAVNTVIYSQHRIRRDYVFNLYINDEVFFVSGDVLKDIGFKIFYKNSCLVELRSDVGSNYIFCEPVKLDNSTINNSPTDVSLL